MKNFFVLTALGLILLFSAGCVYRNIDAAPPHINEPVLNALDQYNAYPVNIPQNGFDKVVIAGNIEASVSNQKPDNQLFIQGTQDMRRSFNTRLINHTLYLSDGNYPVYFGARVPLSLKLDLHTPIQKLTIKGSSITHLAGDWVFSRINVQDNALLYAYWLNSTNLHVFACHHAKVFLGGIVSLLDINARDYAVVDAKYLRVQNAFVRTQNNANVSIRVNNSLSALSTQSSTIYHYGHPHQTLSYLDSHSAILKMN